MTNGLENILSYMGKGKRGITPSTIDSVLRLIHNKPYIVDGKQGDKVYNTQVFEYNRRIRFGNTLECKNDEQINHTELVDLIGDGIKLGRVVLNYTKYNTFTLNNMEKGGFVKHDCIFFVMEGGIYYPCFNA